MWVARSPISRVGSRRAIGRATCRLSWNEVPLREIITEQLKPHQLGPGDRIEITGPNVNVKPNAALALGLVMHELTTNAAKHGSLSKSDGRVSINWSIESDTVPLLVLQ